MRKLLDFYIPSVLLQPFFNFIILIAAFSAAIAFGVNVVSAQSFGGFAIWFVYPALTYFHPKIYLASSLSWILLTPIKKTHIIYANVVLNIMKLLLIYLFCNLSWGILYSEKTFIEYMKYVFTWQSSKNEVYLGVDSVTFLYGALLFLTYSIFAIWPRFDSLAQTGERSQLVNLLRKRKNLFIVLIVGLIVSVVSYFFEIISQFFPSSFVFVACIAFGLIAAIACTLDSVKIYCRDRTLILTAIFLTLIMISTILLNFHLSMRHGLADTKLKLQDFRQMNYYSRFYESDLERELTQNSEKLAKLRQDDFTNAFKDQTNRILFKNVLSHWSQQCLRGDAVGCRLEAYLIFVRDGFQPLKNFQVACPKDMQSCYGLFIHEKASLEDKTMANTYLANFCNKENTSVDSDKLEDLACCSCYFKYKSNKLKTKSSTR